MTGHYCVSSYDGLTAQPCGPIGVMVLHAPFIYGFDCQRGRVFGHDDQIKISNRQNI